MERGVTSALFDSGNPQRPASPIAAGTSSASSDPMAGRCLLYVAGYDQQHWRDAQNVIGSDALVVDVTETVGNDPALRPKGKGKGGKGKKGKSNLSTVDSVCIQSAFPQAVLAIVDAAKQSQNVVVQCRRGVHRSPVCAAAARQILKAEGYSVLIVELAKVQPDLIANMVGIAEDWVNNRRGSCDMPASYNNFSLHELCSEPESQQHLAEIGIGSPAHMMRAATASSARSSPYEPAPSPSSAPSLAKGSGLATSGPLASALPAAGALPVRPPAPPAPPPPPSAVATAASSAVSPSTGVAPFPPVVAGAWQAEAQPYIEEFGLDAATQEAMADLASVSTQGEAEVGKALRKLRAKLAKGEPVQNPSAFVAVACRNAQAKLTR